MAYEKDPNEIGALWVKTSSKGAEYMSGTIEGIGPVVCFRVAKPSEKGPAWGVLKSQPRDGQRDTREAPRSDNDGF